MVSTQVGIHCIQLSVMQRGDQSPSVMLIKTHVHTIAMAIKGQVVGQCRYYVTECLKIWTPVLDFQK